MRSRKMKRLPGNTAFSCTKRIKNKTHATSIPQATKPKNNNKNKKGGGGVGERELGNQPELKKTPNFERNKTRAVRIENVDTDFDAISAKTR